MLVPGATATTDDFKGHVRYPLARCQAPRSITVAAEPPRSITGKTARKELQDRIDG